MKFQTSASGCLSIGVFILVGYTIYGAVGAFIGLLSGITFSYNLMKVLSGDGVRGWQVDNVTSLDPLLGLFMALVNKNSQPLREVHKQSALQVLHQYAHELDISYQRIIDRVNNWGSRQVPVRELCNRLKNRVPNRSKSRILGHLMFVSLADGRVDLDEEELLETIANELGFTNREFRALFTQVKTQFKKADYDQSNDSTSSDQSISEASAYDLLEVETGASRKKIKKKYRELARKYHPDNFQDDSPEARELAKEKMIEINEAYKTLVD